MKKRSVEQFNKGFKLSKKLKAEVSALVSKLSEELSNLDKALEIDIESFDFQASIGKSVKTTYSANQHGVLRGKVTPMTSALTKCLENYLVHYGSGRYEMLEDYFFVSLPERKENPNHPKIVAHQGKRMLLNRKIQSFSLRNVHTKFKDINQKLAK